MNAWSMNTLEYTDTMRHITHACVFLVGESLQGKQGLGTGLPLPRGYPHSPQGCLFSSRSQFAHLVLSARQVRPLFPMLPSEGLCTVVFLPLV